MNNLEVARLAVELARKAGAEQCDAYVVGYDESELTVRLGVTDRVLEAQSRSLGLRVINSGRTAICSTADLSEEALAVLAGETVELARISAPDACAGLPGPELFAAAGAAELQLFDEQVPALTAEEKARMATACEAAALAFDPRITNSDGATLTTRAGEVALASSAGFAASYPSTGISLMIEVMADDADGKKRNAYWFSSERSLRRLEAPEEVGRIAARRAVDQLGARKVATQQVPIVFEPMMAARLLGDFASAANGSALYRRATFLAGRAGEAIASPLVTVVDDARMPGRAGSRPFDGEGVATRKVPLIEGGVFQNFLLDCYTARKTRLATTGSAMRSVESAPSPGTSNLVLLAGGAAPGEIVADIDEGLYLTALMGQGFNPATGDFSRGAAGFWIEGGRLAFPVTEVNVSGRMADMLAGVDAVGDDLAWFGSVAAPTVRIRGMTVAGL